MLNTDQNRLVSDGLGDTEHDTCGRALSPVGQADRCLALYQSAAVGLDGVFVLTLIDPKTNKVRARKFAVGDVTGMAAEGIARASQNNVYFAPGILRKDLPQGERGTFMHLVAVLGLVIDDDADTGKRATLPRGIEQSIEVITSRSPTINRQHHFVFDRPLPPDEAKAVAQLLHRKCGGDHGTKDVAHVWRVPGTLNHPNAAKLKRGRPATPQLVEVSGGSFKLIDPNELRRALEAMPDPTLSPKTDSAAHVPHGGSPDREGIITRLPGWLNDLVETEVEVDDRSSFCYRVMQSLMEHGLSDSEVRVVAQTAPFAAKFAQRGDLDAEIVRERAQWVEQESTRADKSTDPDAANVKMWPIMQNPATHGIAGQIARLATANSEADPVAVIATTLAWAGAMLGRNQFARIGDDVHHSRHFFAIVGESSRARKGTSFSPVSRIFNKAENLLQNSRSTLPFPSGCTLQVSHGPLSSGEGLINAIRDGNEDLEGDDGVADKRILCVEGELGAVLRAFQRTGNTLSTTLRVAFDGSTIAPLTKHSRICATEPHVCIIGHITRFELRELLTGTEIWNGLGNRFMWMCVKRPKLVPLPLPMPEAQVAELAEELARVIGLAHARHGTELVFSTPAKDQWATLYPELTRDRPGILGAVTARAEAHVRRLALTYAQLDGADRVELEHLDAALAIGKFCDESADYLFGGKELDPVGQRILEALATGPKTQTDIVNLFARHKSKKELARVLTELQERGRITLAQKQTGGAPIRQWSLTQ